MNKARLFLLALLALLAGGIAASQTLIDTPSYTANSIYEIQQTDPLEGAATGASYGGIGVDNEPHQQLANRTAYLYNQVISLQSSLATITSDITTINNELPNYVLTTALTTKLASYVLTTTLTADLALKCNIASCAMTGIPTAPTAAVGTSTGQVATTAFASGTCSLAATGYCKLPSSLILEWGLVGCIASSPGTQVNFPLPFPHAVFSVQVSAYGQSATVTVLGQNTSYFACINGANSYTNWSALGY